MERKRISSNQLAKICGVSQGTVDRALNNRKGINAQTKARVLAAAREYGYRPNIHASSMAGGKSRIIGVVVFDLKNQYFTDLIEKIEAVFSQMNYSIAVMFSNKDARKEMELLRNLYDMSADGIVLCPVNKGAEFENFLLSLEIPVITVGNRLEAIPYAGIDNYAAMREVSEFVVKRGYEKLIYVTPRLDPESNTFAQTERMRAFKSVMEETGTEYAVSYIGSAQRQLDCRKKNAFVCPTDRYAVKLYSIAEKFPAGIIGFDNIDLIDELGLALDSVCYDIGKTAQVIFAYITENRLEENEIRYTLIFRGSI